MIKVDGLKLAQFGFNNIFNRLSIHSEIKF